VALLATALVVSAVPAAAGADERPQIAREQLAQAEPSFLFDIPSKPLPQALNDVGRITGLTILYTQNEPLNLVAPRLSGRLTADQALQQLLAGSGYTYRHTDARTVTLEKIAAGTGITLDPVTVEGQRRQETAWGPVAGYVATRSATGTKTDTPLIETPQSISVITKDQMQAQGVENLAEALRYTPGVTGENFGLDVRGYGLQIRGFGSEDTDFYLDGLQLRGTAFATFLTLDPYGAERLEVLRGPSSVLYGQNTPGGILNFVSKRPSPVPFHEVEGGVGSEDRFEGKFDLSGPIDEEGQFQYRLTGLARTGDTQVDFVDQDRFFIAPSFTWQPDEDTTFTFLSHYQRDNTGWTIQFYPAEGTVLPNPNGKIPLGRFTGEPDFDEYDLTQYSVGYLFEHRLSDAWTLRQNARYSHLDNDQHGVFSSSLQADQRMLDRYGDLGKSSLDSYVIDNQAQVEFPAGPLGHTLLFGLDYQHHDYSDFGASYDVGPIDIYNPVYGSPLTFLGAYSDTDVKQDQLGIYLQDQIKVAEKWVFVFGGRHDWADTKNDDQLSGTSSKQKDSAFSGRAGMVYLSETGLAPYVSYSTSFQPVLGTNVLGEAFEPQRGRQWEVGVKYEPPGWDSFITVAAFDLRRQNVLTPDPVNPLNEVQTGEISSRGIELEAVSSLDFGLDLVGSYTYLDAEVTKSNVPGEVGERPLAVAEHMASLWADYTIPEGMLAGLGFGGGVRYIGPSYGDVPNTLEVPGATLFDAAVHYEWNNFRFAINASNIFDKEYIASCYGPVSCFYGAGRQVLGTVTYRW
jgi:iron complex outermembrane receptor protein